LNDGLNSKSRLNSFSIPSNALLSRTVSENKLSSGSLQRERLSGSFPGTPNRRFGHQKSLSDASLGEKFNLPPKSPDKNMNSNTSIDSQARPLSISTSASSINMPSSSVKLSGKPLSVISDSVLLQIYQNSENGTNSSDLESNVKSAAPPTTAVTSEVAIVKLESKVNDNQSLSALTTTGTGESSAPITTVAAAVGMFYFHINSVSIYKLWGLYVAAAAAIGSKKSKMGRRDSTGSSVFTDLSRYDKKDFNQIGEPASAILVDSRISPSVIPMEPIIGIVNLGIEGRDRHVRKLLEAKTLEIFPPPFTGMCIKLLFKSLSIFKMHAGLGRKVSPPQITPMQTAARLRKSRGVGSSVSNDLRPWRPSGNCYLYIL
jgi:hypothetical protein